jgi:hypothetical protein
MERSPMKDYRTFTLEVLFRKQVVLAKKGNLSIRYINLEEIFHVLIGKMFTNGCINIINILTWKKLRVEKVKLASFYLDEMVLYWHQNFTQTTTKWHILPIPTTHSLQKPTRSIRHKDLEERRAKELCFWCDERFIPGHRCKNKRLYSLCIIKDDKDVVDREGEVNIVEHDSRIPHISLNALKGTMDCHTLRVTEKADKHPLYILIDSDSSHNFLNSTSANKLQCITTPIRTLVVEIENGGTIHCSAMCKNFRWRMQGVNFMADVFIINLINCDMELGIQ